MSGFYLQLNQLTSYNLAAVGRFARSTPGTGPSLQTAGSLVSVRERADFYISWYEERSRSLNLVRKVK